jgi:orotidine-5'-phosphate decarboxylase
MTHDAYLQSEGGYIVDDAPELMARAAIDLGVKHFVLPGTKPNIIERFARRLLEALGEVSILMPGIGAQGGSLQIAFQAARPHRSYAIIGSAIYSSNDPLKALRQFVEEARTWQRT